MWLVNLNLILIIMEHFIIIRFSTQFSSSPEFEEKKHKLFNSDRLDFRFYLFENFCLKSIINQTLVDFKVIIIYDKDLPEEYKSKLVKLTENYKYIYLHQWLISDNLFGCKWLEKYLPKNYDINNKYILTTRLDDDDMINYDLNYRMKRYMRKFNCIGKMISFQGGYFLNHYSKDKMDLIPIKYSSLGIFLTKIHKINDGNVYNHTHHNHNLEKRVIKTKDAFIVLNHSFENDNRFDRFKKKKGRLVDLKEIQKIMST